MCALVSTLRAQPAATEYEVKAAYLLNFGKFVAWPSPEIRARRDAFEICVLGDDPFGPLLDATVRGEKINASPVVARRVKRAQDAATCRILFVSRSEEKQVRSTLAGLARSGVLTVSDMPDFLERGGAIQFVLKNNRVRFEVDLDNARASGLALSSELLKVASAVHGKPQGGARR